MEVKRSRNNLTVASSGSNIQQQVLIRALLLYLQVVRLEPGQHRCMGKGEELPPQLLTDDHGRDVAEQGEETLLACRHEVGEGRGFSQLGQHAVRLGQHGEIDVLGL